MSPLSGASKSDHSHRSFDGAYDHFHHFHGDKTHDHVHYGGKLSYEMQRWRSNSASNRQYQGGENYNEHDRLIPRSQKELTNSHEGRWETGAETTRGSNLQDKETKTRTEEFHKLKIGKDTCIW